MTSFYDGGHPETVNYFSDGRASLDSRSVDDVPTCEVAATDCGLRSR